MLIIPSSSLLVYYLLLRLAHIDEADHWAHLLFNIGILVYASEMRYTGRYFIEEDNCIYHNGVMRQALIKNK